MPRRFLFHCSVIFAALASVACTAMTGAQPADSRRSQPAAPSTSDGPLFGFSPFPFEQTPEKIDKVYQLGRDHGEIYVVQRDNGVPWKEALNNEPIPAKIMGEWAEAKRRRPAGQPLYLSIAPLDFDRKNLAAAEPGSSLPGSIKGAKFNASPVKTAYLNYCRTAVRYFEPTFLNIGVEAGELAHRRPGAWPEFAELIEHVRSNLKQEFPDLKIGISFGLQSLMEKKAADLAKPLVESCDYLGLSFYPYMSDFHEKFGAPALPAPPDEWLTPLNWVRAYTDKPIAICETGYNTTDESFDPANVRLKGSTTLQEQYVRDLARIAERDDYLFVVWYFPVDIRPIFETFGEQWGAIVLWISNGLFDDKLNPKPALAVWDAAVKGELEDAPAPTASTTGGTSNGTTTVTGSGPATTAGAATTVATLNFDSKADLFSVPAGAKAALASEKAPDGQSAMEWNFSYAKNQWAWAHKGVPEGRLARASDLSFWVKSDSTAPLIVQLKENNGESHFFEVKPGKDWSRVNVKLSSLQTDPSTRKDGAIDPARITEIVIADGGGASGKKGSRRVVFSRWDFR